MEFILDNWCIIFVLAVLLIVLVLLICRFFRMPTEEQLDAVREWLLGAVMEAEAELGGGTGELKLRYVYDLFVARFPWVAKLLPFERFKAMVSDALVEMEELLAQNGSIRAYVEGGVAG